MKRNERLVLIANLALRAILAVYVIATGHWMAGDTGYYLEDAERVLNGAWGGAPQRTPGFSWFLALLSVKGAIIGQTLLAWLGGYALLRRFGVGVAALWLFDLVILVYSNIIMSDALFAISVLFFALMLERVLRLAEQNRIAKADMAWLGLSLGLMTLVRAIGIPLGAYTIAGLLVFVLRRKLKVSHCLITVAVATAGVTPRLYYNHTRYHHVMLSDQGRIWLDTVAAAVMYHSQGLDFTTAEKRFVEEYPNRDLTFSRNIILSDLPTWSYLTAKGMARVLFGHVNVEWTNLVAGIAPIGPGWFKKPEPRPGHHVEGAWLIPWTAGVLLTALYCLGVYLFTLRAILRGGRIDLFSLWAIGAIALLVFVPQIWGDARFRAGAWPLVLVLLGKKREQGASRGHKNA